MKILPFILAISIITPALPVTAQTPVPHAPAPAVPLDMSGHWTFEVRSPAGTTHGAIRLFRVASGFMGTLTTDQGNEVMPVQSLNLAGQAMVMTVASPHGNVLFSGTLDADGKGFGGELIYYNGRKFPLTARKAATPPPT